MKAALKGVLGAAGVLTAVALLTYGFGTAFAVLLGGLIAAANLWVLAKVVEAFLSKKGNVAPWAMVAAVKLIALIGGVWLLIRSGAVDPFALAIGYGSLPIGITVGSLFAKPDEDDDADG